MKRADWTTTTIEDQYQAWISLIAFVAARMDVPVTGLIAEVSAFKNTPMD